LLHTARLRGARRRQGRGGRCRRRLRLQLTPGRIEMPATSTSRTFIALCLMLAAQGAVGGVLPEDRTDVLYHLYDGGGVQIDGPSLLMRKQVAKNVSVVGNYYVDMVSSASIDVITTASPYTEEREQYSLGMDYLHGNTSMSLGYTSSVESDFE